MTLPDFTLVLGGMASGKSQFAEKLAEKSQSRLIYLATSIAGDEEVQKKIDSHKRRRGERWTTIEESISLADILTARSEDEVLLVECLTMWTMNLMTQGLDCSCEIQRLLKAAESAACKIIFVSGEIGMGVIPEGSLTRRYCSELGSLNQILADRADLVILCVAGLSVPLKGKIPQCP